MTQQKTYAPWNPSKTNITTRSAPGATMAATQPCTEAQAKNYRTLIAQVPAFAGFIVDVAIDPGEVDDPFVNQPDAEGRSMWKWSVKNPKTNEAINGYVGSELAQI